MNEFQGEDWAVCDGDEIYGSFEEQEADDLEFEYDEDEYDGQPDEYTEWQDLHGGDDWDHGQYDE